MKLNNIKNFGALLGMFILGVASAFGFAPFNKGVILLISILGLYYFIYKYNKWFWGILFYSVGFFLAQVYWLFYSLYSVIQIGLINSFLGTLLFVLYLALYPLLAIFIYKRLETERLEFNYLFLFPSVWVLTEWLRGFVFTGFPWADFAYSQLNNFFLQGFFPLVGSYAVSWFFLSVVGFLFLVIIRYKELKTGFSTTPRPFKLAVIYFVLIGVSGYYLQAKTYTQNYGKPLQVALIQGDVLGAEKWDPDKYLAHLTMYAKLINQTKADIVFLPETAIPSYLNQLPATYLEDIIKSAKNNQADLVIGMPRQINQSGDYVNSTTVITQPGFPYYAKIHLVPYGEYIPLKELWGKFYLFAGIPMVGFSSGAESQTPLVIHGQKFAFNICYENGFNSELITRARNATFMVNLSDMVWYGKTTAMDLHLDLSRARALENQRYFIQDTNTGLTAIINPFGQVVAKLPVFEPGTLKDYVQGKVGFTPYQKYGNYPIVIFISVIILIALFIKFKLSEMNKIND